MSRSTIALTPELNEYVASVNPPISELQRDLIKETDATGWPTMQIGHEQALFMTMLTKLVNASFAVEVGTFTGYSSLAIAAGLAPDGKLLCCDISAEWTAIAEKYWERAGVADRIELRIAPALDTLRALPNSPHIDFSFIDADKVGYRGYWDEIVPRTNSGGIIVVDNVLQNGRVVEPDHPSESVAAIKDFNDYVRSDNRVEFVLLPIADGLTIARRR